MAQIGGITLAGATITIAFCPVLFGHQQPTQLDSTPRLVYASTVRTIKAGEWPTILLDCQNCPSTPDIAQQKRYILLLRNAENLDVVVQVDRVGPMRAGYKASCHYLLLTVDHCLEWREGNMIKLCGARNTGKLSLPTGLSVMSINY